MEVATYLLLVLGILGATDIALYHSFSHGIRHHAGSRQELFVHSLRGPIYAALFLLVPNFRMQGMYFWIFILILLVDVAVSIWDFSIEAESRRQLGGLPSGEYVLHILIAMVFGGLVASIFWGAGSWAMMPTVLAYSPCDVPISVRALLGLMAILVLGTGMQDFLSAVKLGSSGSEHPG